MECKEIEEQLIDYIDGNLDKETSREIEKHIENCASCTLALQGLTSIFNTIDKDQQEMPDVRMKKSFQEMLQKEKAVLDESKVVSLQKNTKSSWRTVLQIAATIVLVIAAYLYGKIEPKETVIHTTEVATLKNEKIEQKKAMTISLIENESASKRLQAVNYAEELDEPGNEILKALVDKMHYDHHANVRLAAAEALAKFSDVEIVRNAFVNALYKEQDPSMQIELIHILVTIQEKRAVPAMEKLLREEETPKYVKDQVYIGLPSLL